MKLKGQRVLVTGGAVRIGRAVVKALAAAGCRVAVHYRTSRRQAEALVAGLARQGVDAVAVASNLDTEAQCVALVEEAAARLGGLDILVNNAAVFHKVALREVTLAGLTAEFHTNLFVPFLLTRAFARRAKRGVVINLLDRRIVGVDPECIPYALTKKALAELTRGAAVALAPGIRVNGIAPGAVLPPPGKGQAYLKDKAGPRLTARRVSPGDIADAVVFLASAETVTGAVLFVDGGQHLVAAPPVVPLS